VTAIADAAAHYARVLTHAALRGRSKAAFLTCILWVPVVAQTTKPSFTHLSVAEGLSNGDVRAIVQDRQGFMWFGTWLGGLNRYDGYTLKVYNHDDQEDRSLGCDSIWGLYVDRAGVLWIGTNEGIDRYDRDTDSFVHYRHRVDDATSLPGYQGRFFYEDQSGTLWVASSGGLSRFDRAGGKFFTYRSKPGDSSSFGDTDIRSVLRDATTGLLWVSTWHEGVSVVDPSTGHYTRYKNDPNDPASLSNNDVVRIFQDRNGTVWVSTLGGLNRFDPKSRTFIRYLHDPGNPASLSSDFVTMTYEDRAGRFWVATNNGLNLMDRARGSFIRYLHDPNNSSSLSSNTINYSALYEDASGALWIGTEFAGVDRLAGVPARFTTYNHNVRDARSPSGDVISGLTIDSAGALWIGTEAGLDRFDGHTFTHYPADPNDSSRLNPGKGRLMAQDSHGTVWTGTYAGGLERLVGTRVEHYRHDPTNPDSPANDNIGGLVPDTRGGLWIGVAARGIDYFDGRHFTHFPPNPSDPDGLPDSHVVPLLLDGRGMLWMTTVSWGLARFDTRTGKFTTYLLDPNRPGSQGANWTTDVYSDGASIWVSSSSGLYRFDPQAAKFTRHYTEKDGLPSNSLVGVLGDSRGSLWVSTIKGLSRFDEKTETFRNYDVSDGLPGNQFNERCRAKAPDGRLFFGAVNGLVAFYPDKLADNPIPPRVVLTEFELFNKPVEVRGRDSPLQQAIHVASSLALRYDQSVFSFQFAALNYDSPQKNKYAYKLEGFDRDWQFTDATRRFATYTNLDHGDYTFRVKASNNDGVWNEQGVALHIRILPPWWSTWWFRAVVLASILLSIWCAYQLRFRELRREFNAHLEGRIEERLRVARELHDTLLQSIQATMIYFQAARNTFANRPAEALKMLDTALDRGGQAILEGREAIQGMRSSTEITNDLAQAVRRLRDELSSEGSADFRVVVEGSSRDVHPILRDEVYGIAREALRNAFRHAQAKVIEAEISYGESLRVRIRDDGKGIDPAILNEGRQSHYGLPGMRERAARIGGKLKIWSAPGAGTEIELSIPGSIAYGTTRGWTPLRRFRRNHKAAPKV
jgi:signal transduction histidine kinase/ligand-binding sensor domain-containing protein